MAKDTAMGLYCLNRCFIFIDHADPGSVAVVWPTKHQIYLGKSVKTLGWLNPSVRSSQTSPERGEVKKQILPPLTRSLPLCKFLWVMLWSERKLLWLKLLFIIVSIIARQCKAKFVLSWSLRILIVHKVLHTISRMKTRAEKPYSACWDMSVAKAMKNLPIRWHPSCQSFWCSLK